jgi:hypothetical protein
VGVDVDRDVLPEELLRGGERRVRGGGGRFFGEDRGGTDERCAGGPEQ